MKREISAPTTAVSVTLSEELVSRLESAGLLTSAFFQWALELGIETGAEIDAAVRAEVDANRKERQAVARRR
jgi:hypothetical protein